MPSERERLVEICREIIEERNRHNLLEFEAAGKIADFILADRKRILDAVEKPLMKYKDMFIFLNGKEVWKDPVIDAALSVIEKERK